MEVLKHLNWRNINYSLTPRERSSNMIIVWGSQVLFLWGQIQGAESTRGCTPHPFPITLWIDRVKTQIQSHSSPPCAVPSLHSCPTLCTLWTYAHHAPLSMDSPGKNTEWGTCLADQWLRCLAFTTGRMGLIHGWGTKLQHATPYDQKKKNTGVGCHALLQGIFPIQGLNQHLLCLLHGQAVLYTSASWEARMRQHDVKSQCIAI